jgi:hypothetical protein
MRKTIKKSNNTRYISKILRKLHLLKSDSLLSWFADNSSQYNLTPVYIERFDADGKNNPQYNTVQDIANKLGNKDVKNIALTGPYGSGKSSVIRTLERDFPNAHYLNISLATLEDDTFIKDDTEKKGSKSKEEINHLIEYSILQQIIYKEKTQKLRQSRLKRIQNITWAKSLRMATLLVLAIIAIWVLFQPNFLMVESLNKTFACNEVWKGIWDLLCLLYLIGIAIYILGYIIISTHNSRVNKLNIKNWEIDIKEDNSIFNKHLDEIIYFFEVTQYNVVVIEDLDRFDTTHIFLKLRELNQLLNASNAIHRRIVFIYATRDDTFIGTDRTKFFDYIATVIPVINSSNACDKLKNALNAKGVSENEIDDTTCRDLGLYIDDMRILYNIVDEYLQYREKIDKKLIAKKLLGIILYKNYFPQDFSDLHYRKGTLYSIISHKKQYVEEIIKEKSLELEHLEKQYLEDKDKYRSINGKELRTIYVCNYLLIINRRITHFVHGDDTATPQQLIEDEAKFQKLLNDEYSQVEYPNPGGWPNPARMDLDFNFKDIENSLDDRFGYLQRLNYENEILKVEGKEIEKLQNTIDSLKQLSIAQLLHMHDISLFQTDLSGINDKNHLLEFLVKKGYIDEFYYDYISYFYPGTLTPEDKDFITTLRVGKNKEFHYQLYKFDAVIQELPERSYIDGSVLNISLVKYLIEHIDETGIEGILNKIMTCIKRRKEHEFVAEFYKEYPDCSAFFERLFNKWPEFDMDCLYKNEVENDPRSVSTQFEAFLRYVDLSNIGQDDHYIDPKLSRIFGWINSHINTVGIDRIKDIIQTREICFDNILVDKVNRDLMGFVSNGLYYEYTEDNLKQIVRFHSPEEIANYEKRSLSVLLELNDTILINDVRNNISDYIRCFPKTSTEEAETSLQLILNLAPLDRLSIDYLSKQTHKIKDLSVVSENARKIMALETNVVNPSWANVICFVEADEENIYEDVLTEFIELNIDSLLIEDHSALQNEFAQNLFVHYIDCNILSFPTYKKFRECFGYTLTDTDLSNVDRERISFLVETKCIKFNDYYFDFIKNKHPELTVTFIVNNKEKYIENPLKYSIDSSIAIELLECNYFDDLEKAQIIYSLPNDIEISNHLANIVCNLFATEKLDDLGEQEETLKQYIELSNRTDLKILAITHYINRWDVDDDSIKDLLNIVGDNYSIIAAQKGKHPRLDKTNYNKMLLEALQRKKIISTYDDKESYYKVNTRNLANFIH